MITETPDQTRARVDAERRRQSIIHEIRDAAQVWPVEFDSLAAWKKIGGGGVGSSRSAMVQIAALLLLAIDSLDHGQGKESP
jgi:hypothetical protein